jgi:hypothetical protein
MRLSWEIKTGKYDILFVPAHVRPIINKKIKLVVTIQGLEFEEGRFYTESEANSAAPVAVIGSDIAK